VQKLTSTTRRSGSVRSIAALVLLSLLLLACGGGATTTTAAPVPDELALADDPVASTTTLAPATTTTVAPTTTAAPTTTTAIPEDPYRTWIATAKDNITKLVAYSEPDGTQLSLPFLVPNPHQFGTPLTLMITEGQPGDEWVRVQLPIRPNLQEGWIRTADYDITSTRVHAEVDLSTQQVRAWDGEELIAESAAVIGADASPTPLGTFAVAAILDDYRGAPAVALTAFSEAFETFSGGLPVIAIHVTLQDGQENDPSVKSNGCIRIPDDAVTFLAEHVPLGAPVTVVG
jgi:lipoprotein-anchoring transpeptidase ErfK/SrfK